MRATVAWGVTKATSATRVAAHVTTSVRRCSRELIAHSSKSLAQPVVASDPT